MCKGWERSGVFGAEETRPLLWGGFGAEEERDAGLLGTALSAFSVPAEEAEGAEGREDPSVERVFSSDSVWGREEFTEEAEGILVGVVPAAGLPHPANKPHKQKRRISRFIL